MAILAGGLGTRVSHINPLVPKSLLIIAGKPFIERQLQYVRSQGIKRVVLCVGYLGEQITSIIGDGKNYDLHIEYSFDGDQRLGTGGAILKAIPLLGNDFFILYGDSFLPINYIQLANHYLSIGSKPTLAVFKNNNMGDASNVELVDGGLVRYDKYNPTGKMDYIDYGISILNKSAFEGCGDLASFDLADIYYKLSSQKKLYGHEVFERFYEIGSPTGIADLENFLLKDCD